MPDDRGLGDQGKDVGKELPGTGKLFRVLFLFIILGGYTCQIYKAVHFKYVKFIVYNLHINKSI